MKKIFTILTIFIIAVIGFVNPVKAGVFSDATVEKPCKIAAIGDSITYPYSYAEFINSMPEYQVKNFAMCGTQVAGEREDSFVNRTKLMYVESDIILIFGGTNDFCGFNYIHNPIGNIDDTEITTFCGAYNTMIKNLKQHNPMAKIVLLTPLKRMDMYNVNADGFVLENYVNAVKAVAGHNGLDCIDLYNDPACDFLANGLLIDGLHPNRTGQQIIAGEISHYLTLKNY